MRGETFAFKFLVLIQKIEITVQIGIAGKFLSDRLKRIVVSVAEIVIIHGIPENGVVSPFLVKTQYLVP